MQYALPACVLELRPLIAFRQLPRYDSNGCVMCVFLRYKKLRIAQGTGTPVAAYVFEHADPVHKVTILPTGMALG